MAIKSNGGRVVRNRKLVNYSKYGYIFSIPFVVAFLIFSLYPVIYTTVIGFTDLKGLGITTFKFQEDPFTNFKTIISNATFKIALKNTVIIWIGNFIPQIGIALLLTAWYTDNRTKIKGKGVFKVLFYLPNIITSATIAILFSTLFGYPMGPMNDVLKTLGFIKEPFYFMNDKKIAQGLVMFIQFWMWYGYTMVTLVSGVIGIDPAIFEAAEIDGASRTQTFFFITIPCIRTIMLFTLVTSMIGGLNMFDIPKLLVNASGPDNSTLTTSVFIYNQAFSGSYMYARAAAASMMMFVVIVILSCAIFYILRDKDEEQLAKLRKADRKAERKAMAGGM